MNVGRERRSLFPVWICYFIIHVQETDARGAASSNRGGSSGARIGFSSIQESTTSRKSRFEKYIAGASIARVVGQGLQPYYFSSQTHRYQKLWLDGVCTVTVYRNDTIVLLDNTTTGLNTSVDDDDTIILHFQCPQESDCCGISCCFQPMGWAMITYISALSVIYTSVAIWLTVKFVQLKRVKKEEVYANGVDHPQPNCPELQKPFRSYQLRTISDLLAVVQSPAPSIQRKHVYFSDMV